MTVQFSCFVTGTDTESGKTLVSAALLHTLSQHGVRTAGMKAVAAGAVLRDGVWRNEDADILAANSNVVLPPELATPYMLRDAAAPHIAAVPEGVELDMAHIRACYDRVTGMADAVVVEGVGGFRVPLTEHHDTADLAQQLKLPIILVVGLRLGCLNFALLTTEAITRRGLTLAGWVANGIDPLMRHTLANVEALSSRLPAPLLGYIPRLATPTPGMAAARLDFTRLPNWPVAQVERTISP